MADVVTNGHSSEGGSVLVEKEFKQYVRKYKIDDIYSEQTKYLLVFESPHKEEIHTGIPLSGASGIAVSKAICPYVGKLPFGPFAKMTDGNPIGIMNAVCVPLQPKNAVGWSFDVLESIRVKYGKQKPAKLRPEEETVMNLMIQSFLQRVEVANELSPSVELIACGRFAESFCKKIPEEKKIPVRVLPHPARNGWNVSSNMNTEKKEQLISVLSLLRNSMPLEFIRKTEASEHLSRMHEECKNCINEQNIKWHINSPKRVAACVFLNGKYITEQNIGISKVTGSICAERNAISKAISLFPDVEPESISQMFVLGESGTLLPCGVCCEWLNKINPNMDLFTEFGEEYYLRVKLSEYYGDEKKYVRYRKMFYPHTRIGFSGINM